MRVTIEADDPSNPTSDYSKQVPDYEAISYAWGEGSLTRTLYYGFDKTIPIAVSETVHRLLRDLRPRTGYRLLWIDGVCIHQGDLTDKRDQVPLMSTIYRHATRTIVWL
ncbi:HET-domain-containing protein, partial [Setomelanomma holmii]